MSAGHNHGSSYSSRGQSTMLCLLLCCIIMMLYMFPDNNYKIFSKRNNIMIKTKIVLILNGNDCVLQIWNVYNDIEIIEAKAWQI